MAKRTWKEIWLSLTFKINLEGGAALKAVETATRCST